MGQLLVAFGPILMFMLIPLWIPVIAVAIGAITDRRSALRGSRRSA
jgi:hypothetical protein